MLKQYGILVSCQSEVREASLSDIEKIKLDVQLIECKRLLLGHVLDQGLSGAVSVRQEFSTLHDEFVRVCSSCTEAGVNLLVSRLNIIMQRLNGGGTSDFVVC